MARVLFSKAEDDLVAGMRTVEDLAGWTHSQLADALDLHLETLRGVLFRKNRPGPLVLQKIAAFADRANPDRVGLQIFAEARALGSLAWELLGQPTCRDLLDSIYRRVTSDFDDLDQLLDFIGVDHDEWKAFAAGAEPTSEFLDAVRKAYRDEATRLQGHDDADVSWCMEIALRALKATDLVVA